MLVEEDKEVLGRPLIMLASEVFLFLCQAQATSSAASRAGSRNKRVNVNFTGKVGDYEEYEPGGGYFRSRSPVNYTTIALIAAATVVAVYAVKK